MTLNNNFLELFTKLASNLPQINQPAVIAGGAVANSLYNQKYNHNAPINDIDIFVFYQRETPINTNQDGAIDDYVNDISSSENNLKILTTKRQGIFNIIDVEVDQLFPIVTLGTQLLERFDINATQALLTVEPNPQLVTLPGFNDFLETRQLKCVNPNTPVKTMLRMLKKQKEFNCYLSDNHLMSIFQFARYNNQKMTEETVDKFKDQIEQCKKYFRVFRLFKYVKDKTTNVETKTPIYKVFLKRDLYLQLHRNEKKLIKGDFRKHLISVFDLYYNKSKVYDKYLVVRPYKRVLNTFIDTDLSQTLKNSFKQDLLVHLEKHLRSVQVLSKYFGTLPLNEALDQAQYLTKIKENEPTFYMPFCGHMANSVVQMTLSYMKDYFKKFKLDLIHKTVPLVEKMVLDKAYNPYVKELSNQFELDEESNKMSHCVAGYGQKIAKKLCRIFSITTDEGDSTLEVGFIDANGKKSVSYVDQGSFSSDQVQSYFGVQHRKACNKFPAPKNRIVAKSLINFLNTQVCDLDLDNAEFDPDSNVDNEASLRDLVNF